MPATKLNPGARVRDYHRSDAVTGILASRLNLTRESAHQVIYGGKLPARFAAVIDSFAAAGEFDRMERWLAPVRAALQGVSVVDLTPELIVRSQRADVLEDVAETEYLSNPNAITRRNWIQKLREQQAVGLQLQMALLKQEQEDA